MNVQCPNCKVSQLANGSLVWQCSNCQHYINEATKTVKPPQSRGGRLFPDQVQVEAYLRQGKKCALCGEKLDDVIFQAHHMTRWADGGDSLLANCALLCEDCHGDDAHNNRNYAQPFELLLSEYTYLNGGRRRK